MSHKKKRKTPDKISCSICGGLFTPQGLSQHVKRHAHEPYGVSSSESLSAKPPVEPLPDTHDSPSSDFGLLDVKKETSKVEGLSLLPTKEEPKEIPVPEPKVEGKVEGVVREIPLTIKGARAVCKVPFGAIQYLGEMVTKNPAFKAFGLSDEECGLIDEPVLYYLKEVLTTDARVALVMLISGFSLIIMKKIALFKVLDAAYKKEKLEKEEAEKRLRERELIRD